MNVRGCNLLSTGGKEQGVGIKSRLEEGRVEGEERWHIKNIAEVPRGVQRMIRRLKTLTFHSNTPHLPILRVPVDLWKALLVIPVVGVIGLLLHSGRRERSF